MPRAPVRSRATGPARFYLLCGPENHTKHEALTRRIAETVPPEDRDLDLEYFDAAAADFAAERVLQAARARGMFSARRLIVVRHAEQLRERRHERGQEMLAAGLEALPESVVLIFVTGAEVEGGRAGAARAPVGEKLTAAIRRLGQVETFPLLRGEELAAHARRHASAAGASLNPAAATLLARRAGPELARVLTEVDKLVDFAGEAGGISEAAVAALVPAPVEESVFNLLTHAAAGNRRQAVDSLRRLLESGEAPGRLVPMLGRTLRQLLQAKYLREQRVRPQAGREDLPPAIRDHLPAEGDLYSTAPQPWQRERAWDQAARLRWDHLVAAVDALGLADAGTKGWDSGAADPALALELFVIRFCERTSGRSIGAD